MNRTLIQICFFSILLGLSSIATAEKQRGFPSLDIPAGMAAIYIYRDGKITGSFVKHVLFLNGSAVLPIRNRGCSAAIVEQGKMSVKIQQDVLVEMFDTESLRGREEIAVGPISAVIQRVVNMPFVGIKSIDITGALAPWGIFILDVDIGKSYFLRLGLNEAYFFAPDRTHHSLFLVPEAEALKSASKCKFIEATNIPESIILSWE